MADSSNNQEFSPNAQAVVELAEHLALTTNSVFIGTEHLLQALLGSPCRCIYTHIYWFIFDNLTLLAPIGAPCVTVNLL